MCECVYEHVCSSVCIWVGTLLKSCPIFLTETAFHWPGDHQEAGLVVKRCPERHLFLPSQYWEFKSPPPHLDFYKCGNQTQVLVLEREAIYLLGYLLSHLDVFLSTRAPTYFYLSLVDLNNLKTFYRF